MTSSWERRSGNRRGPSRMRFVLSQSTARRVVAVRALPGRCIPPDTISHDPHHTGGIRCGDGCCVRSAGKHGWRRPHTASGFRAGVPRWQGCAASKLALQQAANPKQRNSTPAQRPSSNVSPGACSARPFAAACVLTRTTPDRRTRQPLRHPSLHRAQLPTHVPGSHHLVSNHLRLTHTDARFPVTCAGATVAAARYRIIEDPPAAPPPPPPAAVVEAPAPAVADVVTAAPASAAADAGACWRVPRVLVLVPGLVSVVVCVVWGRVFQTQLNPRPSQPVEREGIVILTFV